MSLSLDIEKRLGAFRLRVRLDAGDEVLALLGPSGSGKTMTLRCVAGLTRPDRGRVAVDGRVLFDGDRGVDLPPQARRAGLLLQGGALFPHMTVRQNLLAGARRQGGRAMRARLADEALERFGLADLADRRPDRLSGGQRQRAALARLLVSGPDILLLDEPFSALDSHLRFRMEQVLRQSLRDFGRTAILVSHDRDEVFRLADQVAVLSEGRVERAGEKRAVFARPETCCAARLTGCKNISAARPLDGGRVLARDWGMVLAGAAGADFVGIRMHDVAPGPGPNACLCRVAEEIENPFTYTVLLRPVDADAPAPLCWEVDKAAWARLRAPQVLVHLPPEKLMPLRGEGG